MDFLCGVKIYQVLYRLACYLLLLANLIHLAGKYFRYETDTSVGFYSPINITSPNLSLCFDINTILDGYESMVFYPKKPQYLGLKESYLFSRVPKVHEILTKCAYRDPTLDQFKWADNGSDCLSIFNIQRYRMQGLMCYLFQVTKPHTFNFNALSFSLNEPKVLYKLFIDSPLNKGGHTIVPLIHYDELADMDRMFMKQLFPSRFNDELYYLEYDVFQIHRLPSPYTTNCGPQPYSRCAYNSAARLYAKHGFSAISGISIESSASEKITVTNYSYTNDTKARHFFEGLDEIALATCKLGSEACEEKLVVTYTSGPFAARNKNEKLTFVIGSFKFPVSNVIHSPKLPLAEYATQAFTLLNIWVGFSVLACITHRRQLDIANGFKSFQLLILRLTPPYRATRATVLSNIRPFNATHQTQVRINLLKVIASVVFKLTVILIFTVQAINQCALYAQYQTLLHHEHIINPLFEFVLPSTAVCIDINNVFFGNSSQLITEESVDGLWDTSRNWTVDTIFEQSMNEEMLYKCRVRDYNRQDYFEGKFELKSRNECLKIFKFSKYYSNWQICYLFKSSLPRVYSQWQFNFRGTNPSRLYSLILHPKTRYFEFMTLMIYFDISGAPYMSSQFPALALKTSSKKVVMLNFHTNVQERLPKPFDTRCNPVLTDTECRDYCFEAGLQPFNLLPIRNTVLKGSDSILFSYKFMKNATLYKLLMQLERNCHVRCLFSLCSTNFTITYAKTIRGRTEFDVEVVANAEAGPRVYSKSLPRVTPYDFYYQVFCLLSFWLGFTFVGLDFIEKKREKVLRAQAKILLAQSIKLLLVLSSVSPQLVFSTKVARRSFFKRSICNVICFIGMCFHMAIPFIDYFSYPSILLSTISYEKPLQFKFILCSELQDLYEKGIIFNKKHANETIRDVFDESINEILTETSTSVKLEPFCGYWGLAADRDKLNDMKNVMDRIFFESSNKSLCQDLFALKTDLKHGDVCFHFESRRQHDWTRTQMFNTINEMKTILTVSINSSIISSSFTVLVHFSEPNSQAYHSTLWTPSIRKEVQDTRYSVSYTLYTVIPLPYPYSDKGFTPGHFTYCFYHCTNSMLSKFHLARTHLGGHTKLVKYKMPSNSLRGNGTINSLVNWVDRKCSEQCSSTNFLSYLKGNKLTLILSLISDPQPYVAPRKGLTRFDLRRTDDPVMEMKFLVAIFIYDLIINLGSIISIWFGLSVINIPSLLSQSSTETIYNDAHGNLKRTKWILGQISTTNSRT